MQNAPYNAHVLTWQQLFLQYRQKNKNISRQNIFIFPSKIFPVELCGSGRALWERASFVGAGEFLCWRGRALLAGRASFAGGAGELRSLSELPFFQPRVVSDSDRCPFPQVPQVPQVATAFFCICGLIVYDYYTFFVRGLNDLEQLLEFSKSILVKLTINLKGGHD
jgi:hypothetical protein